jgi:FkbM family methyltransferase
MDVKQVAKSLLRSAGFEVSRLSSLARNRNQPGDDPFLHQKRLARVTDVKSIFDVGANRGQTAGVYRRLFPDATIYCFEPFAESFAALAEAYKDCRSVKPFQLALSDVVGTKDLYCTGESVMNSLLPLSPRSGLLTGSTASGTTQVRTTTLDAFCRDQGVQMIDILKIDVQGAELQVLSGAAAALRSQTVSMVFIEVNFNELYSGQAFFHDVSKHLHSYGYNLYGIYQIAYSSAGPIGWADALFVSPRILDRITQTQPSGSGGQVPASIGHFPDRAKPGT